MKKLTLILSAALFLNIASNATAKGAGSQEACYSSLDICVEYISEGNTNIANALSCNMFLSNCCPYMQNEEKFNTAYDEIADKHNLKDNDKEVAHNILTTENYYTNCE